MRKLASVKKIDSIFPIENADSIEVAVIGGWKVVVKKNDFKPQDFVVYCEIDSVLPERQEFEFLRSKNFRIKTIKLRGQISQGICFPISILPAGTPIEEEYDVTQILGVEKYEQQVPAQLSGIAKGNFPSFLKKTDEERVQNLKGLIKKYAGKEFYSTIKLDGSSATFYIKDGQFGVCSRNLELREDENNSYWKVAKQQDIENKLKSLNKNIAIQGELVGPGIQGNKLKLDKIDVYVFNIYDIDSGQFYNLNQMIKTLNLISIKMVPIYNIFELYDNVESFIKETDGMTSEIYVGKQVEGLVYRPTEEIYDDRFGRVSFKCINNTFLLKNNE